ncbi:MAG: hypothetical protein VYE02_03830, partial [Verrucomicrobiota bacterium]|nr:hypothetical protein [Verrucomicrobiota bacterium]
MSAQPFHFFSKRLLFCLLGVGFLSGLIHLESMRAGESSGPIRALMISGGCCHDYPNQNLILSEGISKRAHVAWTLVRQGGSDRAIQIPLYDD